VSVKLESKYIDDINHFKWYENVSLKGDVITYENIDFEEEVVVVSAKYKCNNLHFSLSYLC